MDRTKGSEAHPASFRDPSGLVYYQHGEIFRQVNLVYRRDYDHLIASGLLDSLLSSGLLIPHEEVVLERPLAEPGYKVLRPERLPFVSYPYEWCFSQLKDAALTTLSIQKISLRYGMTLKDASAYNIQFKDGSPVFIDTLSFERYHEGEPWVAYRQFCQHFLAPLALMSLRDVRLGQLLRVYIDGIPLDLASGLLSARTWLAPGILIHLHLHAHARKLAKYRALDSTRRRGGMSKRALRGLVDSLESTIRSCRWKPRSTQWTDYVSTSDHYSDLAAANKARIVSEFLDVAKPSTVWDLGANTGVYSRIASDKGIVTISIDGDAAAVELNYRESIRRRDTKLLPLVVDLTNPSPGMGWEGKERDGLMARGPADVVLALALIHHLAISNNVPLDKLAAFFSRISKWLIIEFVPKRDPRVQEMLATRRDVFSEYDRETFESRFGQHFKSRQRVGIRDSGRTIYLMQRNEEIP